MTAAPLLSVVVIGFDMERELPRTLLSLLPPYQTGLPEGAIEIIVVDNGSTHPLARDLLPADEAVTVIRVEDGGVSPCRAVNVGAARARGRRIAVMVDGARMASPGLLSAALMASDTDPKAFVATLGFHLGPKVQQISTAEGYDRDVEDALLAGIGWPADGHRLFEISALGESYATGVRTAPPETTFFVMDRERFLAIGGFDERFASLGGGFANFDLFDRALEDQDAPLIMLVGEGTFHQLHFGATTREGGIRRAVTVAGQSLADIYNAEFLAIRGRPWVRSTRRPMLFGAVTHPLVPQLFFPDVAS
ncbi:glycosyltransferase [Brevundimonas sp.]